LHSRRAVLLLSLLPAAAHAQSVPGVPESTDVEPPIEDSTPPPPVEDGPQLIAASSRRDGWVALPGVTYTPERGLSVAGALLRYFRVGRPGGRPSRIALQAGVSFTKRAELNFDPNLWLVGDRLNVALASQVSYFDYPYYGIGNDTEETAREDFTAFRIPIRLEALARMSEDSYGGLLYDFRYEDITDVSDGGELEAGALNGTGGGFVSGVGGLLRWDSRDESFYPRSGGLATMSPRIYRRGIGSDHDFMRLLFDASWFFGLGGAHVIAVDGRADFRHGDPPFDLLAVAGGSRLLRGMIEGRYRDNHLVAGQVEYRYPLFWRFGGVAFAGAGRVASSLSELSLADLKYTGGTGLRFAVDRTERINIRGDIGVTAEDWNVYLAIGEAF
jgi:outer membrane protein assembly factor BamA